MGHIITANRALPCSNINANLTFHIPSLVHNYYSLCNKALIMINPVSVWILCPCGLWFYFPCFSSLKGFTKYDVTCTEMTKCIHVCLISFSVLLKCSTLEILIFPFRRHWYHLVQFYFAQSSRHNYKLNMHLNRVVSLAKTLQISLGDYLAHLNKTELLQMHNRVIPNDVKEVPIVILTSPSSSLKHRSVRPSMRTNTWQRADVFDSKMRVAGQQWRD